MNIENPAIERYSTDDFMDLFIAALVLHGKRHIWIRGRHVPEEQSCMYRLHRFLRLYCAHTASTPKEWRRLIVNLRNAAAPSPIGSFDNLYELFRRRQPTCVDMAGPFFETYNLRVQPITARYTLDNHRSKRLRKLAERAAKIYTAEHHR